ncbi:MAG: hypothetical protein ABIS39_03535 [Sphingomicrobium sp.]
MRDELFDRDYQAGRAELHAGIDRAIAGIGRTLGGSLKVLHRLEWNAPWQGKSKRIGGA